jgi:hypothetical protein
MATKICRHNYILVKIRTTSTVDRLVKILRNKYRKEESKDKQVMSAKLKKDKRRKQTRRQKRKQIYYYCYYFSCHRPILPGNSLEPTVIPTAQASSFTLQYFPYYV